MPVQSKVTPCMNAYDLSRTSAFHRLSPKQAVWVLTYVQGYLDTGIFDPLAATKASYDCANEESARTFGYQLISHPKILIAMNRFFGDSPEQSFLNQVEQACFNKKLSVAQVDALKLYGELRGWTGRRNRAVEEDEPVLDGGTAEASPKPRFKVGDICLQDGQKFRVTSLSPDGEPLTATEIE
jgi:hypothetical protein